MKTCKFEERQRQHIIGQALTSWYGGADKIFGRKPGVAPYVPIDLSDEIAKATGANMENAEAIMAMLDRFVPGFSAMIKKGMDTSMSMLSGEIPEDVQAAVLRNSAWQAGQGGYAGTGMSHALTARDLGRTSLDMIQAGTNSAQAWAKLAETSYDPFIVNTMEQASATAANNAGKQATDQFAFNVAAAPDPAVAGTFNTGMAIGSQLIGLFGLGGGGSNAATAPTAAQQPWQLVGGQGGGSAYQYNSGTGVYERVPQAQPVWGGG